MKEYLIRKFYNSKTRLFIRWIIFVPISYLLYGFVYFLINTGVVLFLNTGLHWYFKIGIAISVIMPISLMMICGFYSIAFIAMPNKFFCGLLLGIPFTVFSFWDMFKVISGRAGAGDISAWIYVLIQLIFLITYWITYLIFSDKKHNNSLHRIVA